MQQIVILLFKAVISKVGGITHLEMEKSKGLLRKENFDLRELGKH